MGTAYAMRCVMIPALTKRLLPILAVLTLITATADAVSASFIESAPARLFRSKRKKPFLRPEDTSKIFKLKEDFVAKHRASYSHELVVKDVRDQRLWGGCVSYSTIARLELETGIPLSEQYNILVNLYQNSVELLRSDSTELAAMGLSMHVSADRLELFGAVPAEVWKGPRIDFEKDAAVGEALLRLVNSQIVEFRLKAAKTKDAVMLEWLKRKYEARIRARIESLGIELPDTFTVGGVEYHSPQDFFERALKPHYDAPRSYRPNRGGDFSGMHFVPYQDSSSTYEPMQDVVRRVKESILAGHPVVVAYSGGMPYLDKSTGIMSVSAFHVPRGYREPDPAYLDAFGSSRNMGHVAVIVGVDLDDRGEVVKFKLRNSWGEGWGDRGYGHMYRDFFEMFVYNTWF